MKIRTLACCSLMFFPLVGLRSRSSYWSDLTLTMERHPGVLAFNV